MSKKIKFIFDKPLKFNSTGKATDILIYEHREDDEENWAYRVVGLCCNAVSALQYKGMKKFSVELLDE